MPQNYKKVKINLKFIQLEVTWHQFVLLILGIAFACWIAFNLSFTVKTKWFYVGSRPIEVSTDKIKINK